jgi:hypothetical protein
MHPDTPERQAKVSDSQVSDTVSVSETIEAENDEELNPIGEAITTCLHRVWDIQTAAHLFIPVAARLQRRDTKRVRKLLDEAATLLESNEKAVQVIGSKMLEEASDRVDRLTNSDLSSVLEVGLFLGLF